MILAGRAARRSRARDLLDLVGLAGRGDHRPDELSGGEQQRVAIAVALANEPEVIFADEPTGKLDTATSAEIFGLLRQANRDLGTTIVVVTHDPVVSTQVKRTVAIRDGRISAETLHRTELLDLVGLGGRANHRPRELSGGEQQRVAIARTLANRQRLLLADEPTGQLDSETGHTIMQLIRSIVRADGLTAVVATHDPIMLDVADRVVELRDGAPRGRCLTRRRC